MEHLKKKIISGILAASLALPIFTVHKAEASIQEDVINIAEDQLGVPYRYGGTTPSGFDCSGFVRYVFSKVNVNLPRTSGEQYKVGKTVSKNDLKPGDLVFFANTYKSGISHAGIYVGNNKFISATSSQGIAIASLSSSYWGPKFVAGKRILEQKEPLPAGQYYDMAKSHIAYEAVTYLGKAGIVNGFEDSYFRPNDSVTRGQAAAFINRKLHLKSSSTTSFADVSANMSFASDIAAVKEAGIIQGFSDGTFRPNDILTRAQMAAIIDRAFKLSERNTIASENVKYNDVSRDFWAYKSIVTLKSIDVTSNFNHSIFRSSDYATRADFATALYSAIQAQ